MTQPDLQNLIKAVKRGDIEAILLLTKSGVDVNAYNDQGLTPLCVAAGKGNTEVLKVLIAAGANVNMLSRSGFAPLSFAVHAHQLKAAAILESEGAEHEKENPLVASIKNLYADANGPQ